LSEVVLGLDVGTTSTKAVAFDVDGTERGHADAGYPLYEPASGYAVQHVDEVLAAVFDATRACVAAAAGQGATVIGLACSTAMHSLVGLAADGRQLTDLLTWADTRAAPQAERLKAEHPALHGRTGTPLHPMAPLAKLRWLREQQPETFAAVRRWASVKDLVAEQLTGEWALDQSCASGTGLYDLRRRAWDAEALALAGVTAEQLPRLVPTDHTTPLRPDVARRLGLPAGTPFVIGAGDGPLANLGVGAVRPGVAAVSIGTSGALRVIVEAPVTDPEGRVFCYALSENRWAVGGAINNGGVVLQWAHDTLAPELGDDAEARLLALAEAVAPGSEGLVMLPYLLSERAPHWSAAPRGAYIGLTRHHQRGHLVRAALEGVCQQLAVVLASVRAAGNEVHEIRATGGFARSPFWRQLLTDVLGMDVGFPHGHEGSAFGAALLGLHALGRVPSVEVAADLVEIEQICHPDPDTAAVYERARPEFVELYDALLPFFEHAREDVRDAL
jgi:gluconokinase